MFQSAKAIVRDYLQIRSMVFGVAVFNFALVWTLDKQMGGIGALVDPWYHPWSYLNEPSRLLVAALFLLPGRAWGYLASVGITGYLIIRFAYLFATWNGPWLQEWVFLRKYEPYLVGSYESQFLIGLIVLCSAIFCLTRNILLRRRAVIVGG